MKKLYFIALSFLAGFTITNAQVLTEANHAPALSDMFRTSICSTVGVVPGPSGLAVTWDMSAVSISTNITVFTVVPVPASSQAAYPSASVAVQQGATSNYNFFSSSPSMLNYWGGSVPVSTVVVNMYYTTPAIFATYTMSYGSTNSNTVAGTLDVPAFSVNGTFTGTCSINSDGSGTLAMPSRTFTNVMRVKTNQDLAFTTGFGAGTIIQENYDYYSNLSKTALMTISTSTFTSALGNSSQTVVTVNSDYEYVGVNESIKEITELNLFPNPANNNFNLVFVNEKAEQVSVEITNALGQKVKKVSLENTKGLVNHNIDITNIEAGVYFVKVNVGSRSSIKKLTIQ